MSYPTFDAIKIGIASPEMIREWSYGATQHNIATEKMTEVMFQDLIARSRHRKSFYETTKLIS